MARALDGLFDVTRHNVDECAAAALEAVAVALDAVEENAGLVEILERLFRKGHHVVETDLTPGELDVRRAGLADSAAAQHGDRQVLQILHLTHGKLLHSMICPEMIL